MEVAVPLLFAVALTIGVGAQEDRYSSGNWGQQQRYNGGNMVVPQPQPPPQADSYSSGNNMGPSPGPGLQPSPSPGPGPQPSPSPGPGPGPEPSSEDCPPGESSKMIQTNGRVLPVVGQEFFDVTEEECVQACIANRAPSPDGSPLTCWGYVYTTDLEICLIPSERIPEGVEEIEAEGSYGRKACYPADLVAPCPGPFVVEPQKMLEDLDNAEMEDASTLDECLEKCLEGDCASATFFAEEPELNCLLNKVTRITNPELFMDSDLGKVYYFESGCPPAARNRLKARAFFRRLKALRARRHRLKRVNRVNLLKNAAIRRPFDTKWTLWSRCIHDKQHKYRRCQSRDIRKCPKIMRKCSENESESNLKAVEATSRTLTQNSNFRRRQAPTPQRTNQDRLGARGPECLAIVERGTGRKRCDFGGFRFVDGSRRFCRKPIDCPDSG